MGPTSRLALLVATGLAALAPAVAAQAADHLMGYKATTHEGRVDLVADMDALRAELSQVGCRISGKPRFVFVPADKTNVRPRRPGGPPPPYPGLGGQPLVDDYVCYRLRCDAAAPDSVWTSQLGTVALRRLRPNLLCAPAVRGLAPTTTTSTTTTTTVTTAPATSTTLGPCAIDAVAIDPDGTVPALPHAAQAVPVRVTATSAPGGLFDVTLDDGGAGGLLECPLTGCQPGAFVPGGGTGTFEFTYTPPASPPASVTLRVSLDPHSPGFTCGDGSSGGSATRTFGLVTACGDAAAPQCDGACPADETCLSGGGPCACVAVAVPCGSLAGSPACFGTCPPATPVCEDVTGTCVCTLGAP